MTKQPAAGPERDPRKTAPTRDEMQAAYQIHTLAQMMYGQLVAYNPWIVQTPQVMGMPGYLPAMGFQTPPVVQQWPEMYGYPGYQTPVDPRFTGPVCMHGIDVFSR